MENETEDLLETEEKDSGELNVAWKQTIASTVRETLLEMLPQIKGETPAPTLEEIVSAVMTAIRGENVVGQKEAKTEINEETVTSIVTRVLAEQNPTPDDRSRPIETPVRRPFLYRSRNRVSDVQG